MTGLDRPMAPRWPHLMESEMLKSASMPGEGLCFASSNALRRRAHRAIPGGFAAARAALADGCNFTRPVPVVATPPALATART